jgi:hypothetical protein
MQHLVCQPCADAYSASGIEQTHRQGNGRHYLKCLSCERGYLTWKGIRNHTIKCCGEFPMFCPHCGAMGRKADVDRHRERCWPWSVERRVRLDVAETPTA